jgi:hypothetical protein
MISLIGVVAEHFSRTFGTPVTAKQIRSLIERGELPEPAQLGPFQMFRGDDLPQVEAALRKGGYLPAGEVARA